MERSAGGFELDVHFGGEAREPTVGLAREGILLKKDDGDAEAAGDHHGGEGAVATESDDDVRFEVAKHGARGPEAVPEAQRKKKNLAWGTRELCDGQGEELETGRGDEVLFEGSSGACEDDTRATETPAELVGNGQSGREVSPGASARQDDAS
jgi:hypothetical protein